MTIVARRPDELWLVIAGVIGIGLSIWLNLKWWQSGLTTAGFMIAVDISLRQWRNRDRTKDTNRGRWNEPVPSSIDFIVLPLGGYLLAVGWLLTQPSPSMVHVLVSFLFALLSTVIVIGTVEMGKSLPRALINRG